MSKLAVSFSCLLPTSGSSCSLVDWPHDLARSASPALFNQDVRHQPPNAQQQKRSCQLAAITTGASCHQARFASPAARTRLAPSLTVTEVARLARFVIQTPGFEEGSFLPRPYLQLLPPQRLPPLPIEVGELT
mmetsp:Transcript_27187/g.82473  ORF Transcript_27187/g.82473 Transcript_27187/m.82473 type:complete len:133 (+) Transcript_27187:97-495(+)